MDPRAGLRGGQRPGKFFAEVREQLIAHAAHQFRLAAPRKGGGTLAEHYAAAAAQGSPDAQRELQPPDLPLAGAHLWQWFLELDAARSSNGWGLNPIGYGEIDAWARLTRRAPAPHEVQCLRALDQARLEASAKKEE